MNSSQFAEPFGEIRCATLATGAPLTVSATTNVSAYIGFFPGTDRIQMEGRGYSTAVTVLWTLNPWLTTLLTTDSFALPANTTDLSEAAQDVSTGTVLTLSSMATASALWVGAESQFRGVFVDVNAANTAASTTAAFYWNGSTMSALSVTDGTSSGSASLAQDGAVSWTMPTDWVRGSLSDISAAVVGIPHRARGLYWARIGFNAAMDASCTLFSVYAMNRSTAYAALVSGREELFRIDRVGRHGCIEAVTDAGTASLIVNCLTPPSGRFV